MPGPGDDFSDFVPDSANTAAQRRSALLSLLANDWLAVDVLQLTRVTSQAEQGWAVIGSVVTRAGASRSVPLSPAKSIAKTNVKKAKKKSAPSKKALATRRGRSPARA